MSTILIVEDNPSDLRLMMRAFKKSNLTNDLATAIDGEQALDYLFGQDGDEYRHALPVLILLDIKLPKIDGLEVLEKIRNHERTQMLPVVILTSSKEQEDVARSYKLGVNSYIRKPVDFNHFVEAVQQMGLYWLVLNESPFH
ncbi:response regulator [Phototrophicus methaneseepsis]|nr:response regulator [Phototrophicus methaneseepsis]